MTTTDDESRQTTDDRPGRWSKTIAAWFIVAITLPLVLTLVGVRPQPLENRPPAAAPDLTGRALLEAQTYAELGDYLADRLSVRSLAIRANIRIDDLFFGGARSDDVLRGTDGWLYYRNSLIELCRDSLDAGDVATELDDLVAALDTRGAEVRVLVAPAKPAIYPEYLPSSADRDAACAAAARTELRSELDKRDWYIDLYRPLEQAAIGADPPIYHPQDTHWTQRGSLVMIERLLDAIAPGLHDPSEITATGPETMLPDLVRLLGLTDRDEDIRFATNRTGVSVIEEDAEPEPDRLAVREFRATVDPGGDPGSLVAGRAVIVYDSFIGEVEAFELLAPYFEEVTFVHWDALVDEGGAEVFAGADRVIFEVAEREIANRIRTEIRDSGLVDGL